MKFFTKNTTVPIALINSAIHFDGKTFTSINTAPAHSLFWKKTVLVELYLRIQKIFQDLNLVNEKGVSSWLIGKDRLEDIIQEIACERYVRYFIRTFTS